ncbi:hypothetical protein HYDPIDRAFT_88706 [Hydnomerulius pinastri MD-312]|uniref:Uncharacterized protein n=1 Tax=Hydnomerulius pinastri MD-312 TaxID=994086 RepID=A0A0C9VHJ0_9AGAM|nr:hypothetical protein HYDPIDRAFT_88706 [Hydnomerulius pinastri MD-312]
MSLDQNLFTLLLTPNTSDPAGTVVDLTDPFGLVHYRKRRISGQVYRIEVNADPISEALLASATAPSATTKHKTLELYNPSKVVELKYTGTLSFRWTFKWEEHEFEWRREECFIIRKPDPPVLVAVTKEPPGKIKTASVQLLDYNLNRFDIEDRKGLEIIILTALLTFQDASDTYHDPNAVTPVPTPSTTPPVLKVLTDMSPWKSSGSTPPAPPPPPPRPAPKKGVERIAELQQGRGEVNEVTVVEEGAVKDYAKHCSQLLQDDAMLFVSVRSSDATQVPKVLQVVEETKRTRHKAGEDMTLHQYVLYDTEKPLSHKGPRVINLDDGKGKSSGYSPPTSLVVHLSKIDMPELRPRQASSSRIRTSPTRAGEREPDAKAESKKERKEREKREKERKEKEKKDKDKSPKQKSPVPNSNSPPAASSRLQRPRSQHFHTLPDPATYAAPPPSFARSPPQHGGRPSYRRSMYGSLNAYYDQQGHDQSQPPTVPLPSSTGRFGRFIGGR